MDAFYALAEPRRRRIIEIIAASGQLSATQIYKKFNVTAQAVSQHLTILRDAGLVKMEKRAQQHIYSLDPSSISEVGEWAQKTQRLWNKRLDRLEDVIGEEKRKSAKKR
ncbi:MAG: helix-turn-helix transcriptional regulator [Candidatus Micrarchaeota archaeon]|nr:helix-turn-helix transcriptional regulator [Candidatus Micrarchaeota archaeon]MDE1804530.1 helix-turn-helix transcriptional regulator [Candidatus Micrarchaeota archaeon]MDE1846971.1 helix-turn-helix transcriptional regulator [Candidatus Micrarchaeota archaeon]